MNFETAHRPWPLPERPWAMAMNWHDLLFMHWPISIDLLRDLIPRSLELDTFDSQARLGIVPFRMTGVTPRGIPALPGFSKFAEINVRTYVTFRGKPGVWFFSLDAANPIAVRAARWIYHLPYFNAQMLVSDSDGTIQYQSKRVHKSASSANFVGEYKPMAPVSFARSGTIEHWLTERYCLYAVKRNGQVFRGEIHHNPWPLQAAESQVQINSMTEQLGFNLPETKPLLHFARKLEVVAWALAECT
jgi:uncharacterized protein YqjF (DUF2071 family)